MPQPDQNEPDLVEAPKTYPATEETLLEVAEQFELQGVDVADLIEQLENQPAEAVASDEQPNSDEVVEDEAPEEPSDSE